MAAATVVVAVCGVVMWLWRLLLLLLCWWWQGMHWWCVCGGRGGAAFQAALCFSVSRRPLAAVARTALSLRLGSPLPSTLLRCCLPTTTTPPHPTPQHLYLEHNAIRALPPGPYLRRLVVLSTDWEPLLRSHALLAQVGGARQGVGVGCWGGAPVGLPARLLGWRSRVCGVCLPGSGAAT